ncbi:MAG: hypothetical protein AAF589_06340 [Planctomycetota bacterium]
MNLRLVAACVFLVALSSYEAPRSCGASDRWSPTSAGPNLSPIGSTDVRLQIKWRGVALRDAAKRLGEASSGTVFLDRRVDPTEPVTLSAAGVVSGLIEQLAAAGGQATRDGLGVSSLGGVYYLGPALAARDLRTLHARSLASLDALPETDRRRYFHKGEVRWSNAAEPAALIRQALREAGLELANAELIAHDRWRQGQLPRGRLCEQLTLLLIGFGLEWRPDTAPDTVRLQPIEHPVAITASHIAARDRQIDEASLQAQFAYLQVNRQGWRWTLTGRWEDHARLHRLLTGAANKVASRQPNTAKGNGANASIADKRVSLTVRDQPARAILAQLAASLGLQVRGLDKPGADKRVSLSVSESTVTDLLVEIGRETGLSIELLGDAIVVSN